MTAVSVRSPAGRESARERILRAAARLYTTQGFEGTSVREIAAAAGVTKPLVSYHFGSKEQLYSSLLQESVGGCEAEMRGVLAREREPRARLQAILAAQFARAREAPEIVAFAHEVLVMPGMLPLGFDYRVEGRRLFDLYVELITDGQARGAFRPGDPRAVVVMAVATVAMYSMAVLSGNLPAIPPGVEDTVFDLLMGGVEVRPAGRQPVPGVRRGAAARRAPARAARRVRPAIRHQAR